MLICSKGAVIRTETPREVAKTPEVVSLRRGLGEKFCQPICTNIYEKKYKRNDAKGHIDITKCHHGRYHSEAVNTHCLSRAFGVGNRAQSSTWARLPPKDAFLPIATLPLVYKSTSKTLLVNRGPMPWSKAPSDAHWRAQRNPQGYIPRMAFGEPVVEDAVRGHDREVSRVVTAHVVRRA